MKLRKIILDKNEQVVKLNVDLTMQQAYWLAKMTGKINSRNSKVHSEIYDCLNGAFFNKFYEDGVDDVDFEHKCALPEIEDFVGLKKSN